MSRAPLRKAASSSLGTDKSRGEVESSDRMSCDESSLFVAFPAAAASVSASGAGVPSSSLSPPVDALTEASTGRRCDAVGLSGHFWQKH